MFWQKQRLTSKFAYTHFSANKIVTPPMLLSFPTQNNQYLESFPSPTVEKEKKNAMENKVKLLETENKLLKDDLSNKQKIIGTILMRNSKLIESQNSIHLNENDI